MYLKVRFKTKRTKKFFRFHFFLIVWNFEKFHDITVPVANRSFHDVFEKFSISSI